MDAPFVTTAGDNNLVAPLLGAYFTYMYQDKLYLDALMQGTYYAINAKSFRLPSTNTNAGSFGGSLEGGYRYPIFNVFSIQPQLQLTVQTLGLNNTRDIASEIRFDQATPYAGRVGLLGEYSQAFSIFNPLTLWILYLILD